MRPSPRLGWIGVLATTGLCSYFGARAAAILVMVHSRPAMTQPLPAPLVVARRVSTSPGQSPPALTGPALKPAIIADRNMFCSDCAKASALQPTACGIKAADDIAPTRSTLPLSLTATLQDTSSGARLAVIHDHVIDRVSVLTAGSVVPGAGSVTAILATRMIFVRRGQHEYIDLRSRAAAPTPASPKRPAPTRQASALAHRVANGIRPRGGGK